MRAADLTSQLLSHPVWLTPALQSESGQQCVILSSSILPQFHDSFVLFFTSRCWDAIVRPLLPVPAELSIPTPQMTGGASFLHPFIWYPVLQETAPRLGSLRPPADTNSLQANRKPNLTRSLFVCLFSFVSPFCIKTRKTNSQTDAHTHLRS